MNYCDILWVDDFDNMQSMENDPRKYLKHYFSEDFKFRVHIETNFIDALVHLENNFTNYSCVILDVNFKNGFDFEESNNKDKFTGETLEILKNKKLSFSDGSTEDFEKIEDDYEKDEIKSEFGKLIQIYQMYNILKNNNVLIKGLNTLEEFENFFGNETINFENVKNLVEDFNSNGTDFKNNAGYYLFLYLLQRGMPQKNIAMLTGNEKTSEKWKDTFKNASLQSPKSFDRKSCELTKTQRTSDFIKWLEGVFYPSYKLRTCIIAMTALINKMLDDENIKINLLSKELMWGDEDRNGGDDKGEHRYSTMRDFHPEYIPLHLPNDEKKSSEVLFPFISQVIVPWDKSGLPKEPKSDKNEKYTYYVTMKNARNWLVHRNIQSITLQTECFLFGICMRGMFKNTCSQSLK